MGKELLEKSPDTLVKFFINQGNATPEMFNDAYIFYQSFGTHKDMKKGKTFTRRFLRALNFYNSNFVS